MMRLDVTGASHSSDGSPSLSVFDRVNREIEGAGMSNSNNNNNSSSGEEAVDSSLPYSLSSSSDGSITSLVFKSDYANLKHAQSEIQRALQELGDTHAQRIARYIS